MQAKRESRTPGLLGLTLATAFCLLSACTTTSVQTGPEVYEPSDWLLPSPLLAQQIEDEARRLPWTHGIEHLEQIRWFASVGEPAYNTLLDLAVDPRPKVSAAALAALGATGDLRLVPTIQALEFPDSDERGPAMELEYSRTLVRLGDWDQIPALIEGLTSPDQHVRTLCDQALYEATNQRFGYDPRGPEHERTTAIRQWEAWWLARTGEGLIMTGR